MVDAIERAARDVARNVWPPVRDFLQLVLWMGWMGIWLFVATVGALVSFDPLRNIGLAVAGVSLLLGLLVRAVRKRRLRKRARRSLIARAKLERLRLTAEMESILSAFDIAYRNVLELLAEPAVAGEQLASNIARDVEKAREYLMQLAELDTRYDRDLRELSRLRSSAGSVSSSSAELREKIHRNREESDAIVTSTRRLTDKLSSLRQLSGAALPAGSAKKELEEVLEDLDRTAAAYREIDQSELGAVETRARERARAKARSLPESK